MAGAAHINTYALNLALIMIILMISVVFGAEEAESPSPSPITGAAYMTVVPFLAPALVGSLLAIFAYFFH